MICYPLDNTEYLAQALGAYHGTRTRGVFASDGHFDVTSNADMTLTISPGIGWLKADTFWGVVIYEENPQVLSFDIADGSLPRIDAICVRLNKNGNVGEIVVKKGAYSPQPPVIVPPSRNLDYDEIYVASVRIRAGATSILASDITDQRLDETYCGIMRDGVTGIPTQVLYDAFWGWFAEFKDDSGAIFTEWFDQIKGQLSEDAAGNLQNQIDEIKEDMPPKIIQTTLLKTKWNTGGTGKYRITHASIFEDTDTLECYIEPDIGTGASAAQAAALFQALGDIEQHAGYMDIVLAGSVPTVDIPVRLTITRKEKTIL